MNDILWLIAPNRQWNGNATNANEFLRALECFTMTIHFHGNANELMVLLLLLLRLFSQRNFKSDKWSVESRAELLLEWPFQAQLQLHLNANCILGSIFSLIHPLKLNSIFILISVSIEFRTSYFNRRYILPTVDICVCVCFPPHQLKTLFCNEGAKSIA